MLKKLFSLAIASVAVLLALGTPSIQNMGATRPNIQTPKAAGTYTGQPGDVGYLFHRSNVANSSNYGSNVNNPEIVADAQTPSTGISIKWGGTYANNNGAWNYIKIGAKQTGTEFSGTFFFQNTEVFPFPVSKVVFEFAASDSEVSGIHIHTSTDSSFSDVDASVEDPNRRITIPKPDDGSNYAKAFTYEYIHSSSYWPSNTYFRITVSSSNGSNNRGACLVSMAFTHAVTKTNAELADDAIDNAKTAIDTQISALNEKTGVDEDSFASNLPLSVKNATITYSSTNPAFKVNADGSVDISCPTSSAEASLDVTLSASITATIGTLGDQDYVTKTDTDYSISFSIFSEEDCLLRNLSDDLDELDALLGSYNGQTDVATFPESLPLVLSGGSEVVWASDNSLLAIDSEGDVTFTLADQSTSSVTVNLKADITNTFGTQSDADEYEITFDVFRTGGSCEVTTIVESSSDTETVEAGTSYTLDTDIVSSIPGKVFSGWKYQGETDLISTNSIVITGNTTIVAVFVDNIVDVDTASSLKLDFNKQTIFGDTLIATAKSTNGGNNLASGLTDTIKAANASKFSLDSNLFSISASTTSTTLPGNYATIRLYQHSQFTISSNTGLTFTKIVVDYGGTINTLSINDTPVSPTANATNQTYTINSSSVTFKHTNNSSNTQVHISAIHIYANASSEVLAPTDKTGLRFGATFDCDSSDFASAGVMIIPETLLDGHTDVLDYYFDKGTNLSPTSDSSDLYDFVASNPDITDDKITFSTVINKIPDCNIVLLAVAYYKTTDGQIHFARQAGTSIAAEANKHITAAILDPSILEILTDLIS